MANLVSISRIFFVFIAVGLLYFKESTAAYVVAFIFTVLAFSLDALDGYLARKFNEVSKLGAVLDIMGDRIAEYAYWIMLAHMGWIPVIFPLISVTRGVITDGLRSVALEQGLIPFGKGSMLNDEVCQWICGSKVMKVTYAAAKAVAFALFILAYTPNMPKCAAWCIVIVAALAAEVAILLCVLRGIPVIFESKKFFVKEEK
ncbi:CDP-alcohol phosphatidyltransferase family protein [bacterium]|nr:CDP-alcohol phosphatidyltransferase family protein [bacterium]